MAHTPWFRLLLIASATLFIAASPDLFAEATRPNVIVVLTDDQGSGDFSSAGNPVLKTPRLDELRAQSMRFVDFHVAPMCTPTRGQLLTGLDAVRNGATSVTGGRSFLRVGTPTLPELLSKAGYRTGIFGKWHLGDNYPHRPLDRGFQESVYHLGWGFTAAPEFSNTLFDGRYFHNGAAKHFPGHCTDFWFTQAMAWMRERHAQGEPFFCYLPTNAPHAPHVVAEKYSAPYTGQGPANFFGMIAQIDENMGRLDKFLRDSKLLDNTIVVFLTDNGGTAGVKTFNAGLRAGKTTFYEGGHRVPCWIRWPAAKWSAARDIDVPTQVQDLLPTLLDLCGVEKPAEMHCDGTSLAPLLKDPQAQLADRKFVVQYSRAKLEKWQSCVVWNQWRLVHGEELYDIRSDRLQQVDLAQEHPEIFHPMRAHYEQWWSALAPLSSKFVSTHIGSPRQTETPLTSSDWQDVYCDNSNHIRQAEGGPQGGHWNVVVEQAGNYEIELRRWPRELDLSLSAPSGDNSKSLAIAGARLVTGGQRQHSGSTIGAKQITFRMKLEPGPTQLHGWFEAADGEALCGAFYAYVRRLP